MKKISLLFFCLWLPLIFFAQKNCDLNLNLISKKVFVTDQYDELQQVPLKVKLNINKDSLQMYVDDNGDISKFTFLQLKNTLCTLNESKTNGLFIYEGLYQDIKEDTTYSVNAKFVCNLKNVVYTITTTNKLYPNQNMKLEMIEDKKVVKIIKK